TRRAATTHVARRSAYRIVASRACACVCRTRETTISRACLVHFIGSIGRTESKRPDISSPFWQFSLDIGLATFLTYVELRGYSSPLAEYQSIGCQEVACEKVGGKHRGQVSQGHDRDPGAARHGGVGICPGAVRQHRRQRP